MIANHWRWMSCIAAAAFAAAPAAAQRVTVRGQVVDAQSGQPVAAAVVEVMPRHEQAMTDRAGRFQLRTTAGDHSIVSDALGYGTAISAVSLAGDTTPVRIELRKDPVRLAAITATASRLESRRRSVPVSVRAVTAEQIATSAAPDMYQYVRTNLGVMFTGCGRQRARYGLGLAGAFGSSSFGATECVYARGGTAPAQVYVDEVRVPDPVMLASYDRSDIAAVEVYGGGQQIRVYTRWFMDWAAKNHWTPLPLSVASF